MSEASILIEKYLQEDLTEVERQKLMEWVLAEEHHKAFFENRISEHDFTSSADFDTKAAYKLFSDRFATKKTKKIIPLHYFKYAAVGTILLALALFMKSRLLEDTLSPNNGVTVEQSIDAGEKGIVLKLGDGSTQNIDSKSNGLVQDVKGNVIANKNEGQLTFGADRKGGNLKVSYNEIYVPNGEKFKIIGWNLGLDELRFKTAISTAIRQFGNVA